MTTLPHCTLALSDKLAFADVLVLACIGIFIVSVRRFYKDIKDRWNRCK